MYSLVALSNVICTEYIKTDRFDKVSSINYLGRDAGGNFQLNFFYWRVRFKFFPLENERPTIFFFAIFSATPDH